MMTTTMKRRICERAMQTTCLHRPTIQKHKQDVGGNIIGNKEGVVCREAMEKKNCKQDKSAIKAMKIFGQAAHESGVGIGALVSL
jgi:hypothetical protein